MDENLLNAYAYSNLQKALLCNLMADILSTEKDPGKGLQVFYNDTRRDLEATIFPAQDLNSEEIRRRALALNRDLFKDIEVILLRRRVISESGFTP